MGIIQRVYLDPPSDSDSDSRASIDDDPASPLGSPSRAFPGHHYHPEHRILACSSCGIHLSLHHHVISKSFQGHHGRAWLFDRVYNVLEGPPAERIMTTGPHVVCDILCKSCCTILGWKYLHASESSQRYKEGRFIMERNLLCDVA
ncbi:yippee zinc-binding/DNA-binding /Mis18, centromere assembly-domain-containing protein [Hyaloraphidium curvatum]|nr:yippee zinc-binding/DNA-binding /Mis18, centromere assembly-domain-containing protein [Hyaloraphidium curvatum]